jgi:hypothetical protein
MSGVGTGAVSRLRDLLWANGWRPLPVLSGGKAPLGANWPELARRNPPDVLAYQPVPHALNTGLLCDGMRAIDLDIEDPAVADAVHSLASTMLGPTPVRTRDNSPRRLLPYRASDGQPLKRVLAGRLGKIEVLGRGQQFVAYGTHPSGAALQWLQGGPDSVAYPNIPEVTEEALSAFLAAAAPLIGAEPEPPARPRGAGNGADQGGSFFAQVNAAALADAARWVPALFAGAKYQPGTGAWRVASEDRGRPDLEEDISIHPAGITDFGEEHGRSPIDLVLAFGPPRDPAAAALWLCGQLAIEPASLGWRGGHKAAPPPRPDAPEPEPEPRGTRIGRLLVLSVEDAETAPPRDYLMKGLISPAEISVWVGPPKCGKSFLMLYISYMLSLGRPVFGRRVKPTRVLYVAAEGEAGIANRIRALRGQHGHSEAFHFIAQPADLLRDGGNKAELIKAATLFGSQLIILDTLSRLLAGGDENSPEDMGGFVVNVADVRHDTGAHMAIVHHGTKASNGTNPRGHSLLIGATDALIEVVKAEDGSRTATVTHAKDDADGMVWPFRLDVIELGFDPDGDPITTLLASEVEGQPEAPEQPQRAAMGDNLTIAFRTLHDAIKVHGVADPLLGRMIIAEADWREWFYREGRPGATQEAKKKAFQRAVSGLLARGVIATRDDRVWPI